MGRKKRVEGTMPLPRGWLETERLAACLAYLNNSQKGDSNTLDNDTCREFPAYLQQVHDHIQPFVTHRCRLKASGNGPWYDYTLEEAKRRRPGVGKIIGAFRDTRWVCNNHILPVYMNLLNEGEPPSGTSREQLIEELRLQLGLVSEDDAERTRLLNEEEELFRRQDNNEPTQPAEVDRIDGVVEVEFEAERLDEAETQLPADPEAEAEPPHTAATAHAAGGAATEKKLSKDKIEACMLTFLHLGPLGEQHAQFMPPADVGSTKADQPARPPGRDTQKKRRAEEPRERDTDAEWVKVEELQKLRRLEEKNAKTAKKTSKEMMRIKRDEHTLAAHLHRAAALRELITLSDDEAEKAKHREELKQHLKQAPICNVPPESAGSDSSDSEDSELEAEPAPVEAEPAPYAPPLDYNTEQLGFTPFENPA